MITGLSQVLLDIADPADALDAYARMLGSAAGHPQLDLAAGRAGLVFTTADLDAATRLVARRGLTSGTANGLAYEFTPTATGPAAGDIREIDHLVLTSPARDRVIATLSGRLGMDLRLDRVQPWGVHQLFFTCAGLMVEVVLRDDDPSADDTLWGIAWRTGDIDASYARLTAAGVTMSGIRTGAKPGTRVCTVKDPALGVPTILIEQS